MNEDFDTFLKMELLAPPVDFTQCVMQRISELPLPVLINQPSNWGKSMQWIALIGAGFLGTMQLVAFMFGIWTATAAG